MYIDRPFPITAYLPQVTPLPGDTRSPSALPSILFCHPLRLLSNSSSRQAALLVPPQPTHTLVPSPRSAHSAVLGLIHPSCLPNPAPPPLFLPSGLRILLYSGDADASVPTLGTRYWLMTLNLREKGRTWSAWRSRTGQVCGGRWGMGRGGAWQSQRGVALCWRGALCRKALGKKATRAMLPGLLGFGWGTISGCGKTGAVPEVRVVITWC